MTHRRHHEAGDTLIEVLLALLIVSITVVALMSGLATAIKGSSTHRSLTSIDTVLKSFAETATYDIQLGTSPLFTQCAPVSGTSYNGTPITLNPPLPTGYAIAFTNAQYWSTATNGFVTHAACAPASQSGFQLLTVTATGPQGNATSLSFGVRAP
jgi:type II secretory pathway pseudopilin PulG